MTHRWLGVLLVAAVGLESLDQIARREMQEARRPWLEAPMRLASDGSRPLLWVGGAVALLSGGTGRAFAAEACVALAPVNLVVEVTKYATDRRRPSGGHRRTNAAFPSSHAANAFAIAVVLARRWGRSAWIAFPLASLVAASRVYLDRHWLSDVLAGALVGGIGAWACVSLWRAWRGGRPVPVERA